MSRVVVITGASAGIGYITAKMFQDNGDIVYNLSRRETKDIKHIKTDVTNREDIKKALIEIYNQEGRIDVLVNNAGMGISGAVENTESEAVKKMFDVNFYGALYAMQEVVPYMREGGGGMIINVSSLAARLPLPFQAFYSATKSALCSLSDALRLEVKPFNIKVTSILPGDVKTEFTAKREKNQSDDPIFGDRIIKSVEVMEKDEQNGLPPERIGKIILKLSRKTNPPPVVIGVFKYSLVNLLAKILPHRLVVYIMGKIYG